MRRRRRNNLTEVNLTPLLDVLFSILFIVMMTGAQTRDNVQRDHEEQVASLEEENSRLSEALTVSEEKLAAYELHESDSVIITVRNISRGDDHILYVYRGVDENEIADIRMGLNQTENTRNRIRGLIEDTVGENNGQPVYIVFYADKSRIYTREYNAVVETLEEMQARYKEVFFKVAEEE